MGNRAARKVNRGTPRPTRIVTERCHASIVSDQWAGGRVPIEKGKRQPICKSDGCRNTPKKNRNECAPCAFKESRRRRMRLGDLVVPRDA